MSRVELLEFALRLKVNDADVMTRPELRSAIQNAQEPRKRAVQAPVTWLGVARRLVASVIEQGLNLPEAASLVRGELSLNEPPSAAPPVATVTLARIYAAQGHVQRAVDTLQKVLDSEPDHDPARELCNRLRSKLVSSKSRAADSQKAAAIDAVPVDAVPVDAEAPRIKAASVEAPQGETASAQTHKVESRQVEPAKVEPAKVGAPQGETASAQTPKVEPRQVEPAKVEAPQGETASIQTPKVEPANVEAPKADAPVAESRPSRRAPALRTRATFPQVVLIRTEDDELFAYWEAAPTEASQLILVAHGVATVGREERVFPLYSSAGAMELTGIDPQWVIRAMLRSGTEPQAGSILAVASCVVSEGVSRPGAMNVEFSPHARAMPKEVALRAAAYLATAPANAW